VAASSVAAQTLENAVVEEESAPTRPREITFTGTWFGSKDELKERPKTIAKGVLTWTNGSTTLLHFADDTSVEMTFQGAELKGELKEDSIFWDDGDVWVRDATSEANGYSQGFVPTQDPATGRSTKRAQKGAGKGKHRLSGKGKGGGKGKHRLSSKGKTDNAAKRHRLSLRAPVVALSPAERLAELQAKAKLAEERRQDMKEAATERAAIRQVHLESQAAMAEDKRVEKESKAQMAEEKRKEKQALADIKAAMRKVNLEHKAKMAEQKEQEKKRLREVAKDEKEFKNAVKSSLNQMTSSRSVKPKVMATETGANEGADAERTDLATPMESEAGGSDSAALQVESEVGDSAAAATVMEGEAGGSDACEQASDISQSKTE
jgi:hypothetical protein